VLIYLQVHECRVIRKPFDDILSGIALASALVTPFGAIPSLEAMSISPYIHACARWKFM